MATSPPPIGAMSPSQAVAPQNVTSNVAPESGPGADELIAADENVDEAFDLDDNVSSSMSITTGVLRYREENGRRYHGYKDGAYVYPNDATEQDRLELQHHMFNLTFDALFLCPMDTSKVHRVLDLGTGTGCWAVDFADQHPHAEVIGTDLSAIQPEFVPPNVQFYIDDIEDDWTYSKPFDFILSRMLTGSVANWPRLFKQAYDNLAPGGYFELVDICIPWKTDDGTLPENAALSKWLKHILEASQILGRPLNTAESYAKLLEETGFVNIAERQFKWPMNNWPRDPKYKELGILTYETAGRHLSAISMAPFTRALGWSREQCEVFLVDVRRDVKDPNIHAYVPVWVVYGQKPLLE